MSQLVREGRLDLAIVAGPRVAEWPSVGARVISTTCAEMGLTVGMFGGQSLRVHGVIPQSGTGGIVVVEDLQHRIHRIHARAVVKITPEKEMPDPFQGWRSQGLIPMSTAERLFKETQVTWKPAVVILGVGNRALRFGSTLLETERSYEVYCVEAPGQPKARTAWRAWEVEQRRFEILGGKTILAQPLSLTEKGALLWSFRLQDSIGVRLIDVARVVSAGPFSSARGYREYPPGSNLFEFDQVAPEVRALNTEGWALEEERGLWLASRIVKALGVETPDAELQERFRKIQKRAKSRLRRHSLFESEPTFFSYESKWIQPPVLSALKKFSGVPANAFETRPVASLECFEDIPCNLCEKACPESAIKIVRSPPERKKFLMESNCTACGLCINACPSGTPILIHDQPNKTQARLTLAWRGKTAWKPGDFPILLNRRGEGMGSGRVVSIPDPGRVEIEIPSHLVWEVRGIKRAPRPKIEEDGSDRSHTPLGESVEVTLNGQRRLLRQDLNLTLALFETGLARPQDILACKDGSCQRCTVTLDGIKKLACESKVHRGMVIKTDLNEAKIQQNPATGETLCPCTGAGVAEVADRIKESTLRSPEAIQSVTKVGTGRCHGMVCRGAFVRLMDREGVDSRDWIDWGFPWMDWVVIPSGGLKSDLF